MTQTAHGGKTRGCGVKPKSPEERRDQVFSIKLTLEEKQLLEKTDARDWGRDTLIRTAKRRVED